MEKLRDYSDLPPHLQHEAAFADTAYERWTDQLIINVGMYAKFASPSQRWDWRQYGAMMLGDLRGKAVLDMGCGMGEEAVYLAKMGANVTAIDISSVGVELTRRRAEHNGLADSVEAFRMRADATEFPDASFDLIHGFGILHHIGLGPGLAETRRLLKPGGRAIFFEHMGNSRLIEWLRNRWAANHTDHEKPLRWNDVRSCRKDFAQLHMRPFYVLSRLRSRFGIFDRDIFKKIDYYLLGILPPLRHFASGLVIVLQTRPASR